MGWNVGLNAGGWGSGLLGVALTMTGIMVPSTTLTYMTAQWGHRNRQLRWVRAFKQGMAPIVIGLLLATAWILGRGVGDGSLASHWPLWLTTIASALLVWRTRLHMLWLLAAGAALGWFQLL
jgi:chromate transporter